MTSGIFNIGPDTTPSMNLKNQAPLSESSANRLYFPDFEPRKYILFLFFQVKQLRLRV